MADLGGPGLRVALVSPSFPPLVGGIETHVSQLARGLAALGCQVDVLAQWRRLDGTMPADSSPCAGVDVHWFRSRTRSRRFPFAPGLVRYLRGHARDYDIVHGHSYHAVPAAVAALLSTVPFVYTPHFHGGGHTTPAKALHLFYGPIGRATFARASAIFCNTEFEASKVRKSFPFVGDRIRLVYPGVDADELLEADPYEEAQSIVLTAGRLEGYKQLDLAVRAMPLLPASAKLVIVGDGPQADQLGALADDLGVASRVSLLGRLDTDAVRRWQRTAHVTLTLSLHEAFGLVLLEGLAAGSRVVASRIPAHEEVARLASRVRFVASDATPSVVAEAIAAELDCARLDPSVDGLPTWSAMSARCLSVYDDVLGVSSTAARSVTS